MCGERSRSCGTCFGLSFYAALALVILRFIKYSPHESFYVSVVFGEFCFELDEELGVSARHALVC